MPERGPKSAGSEAPAAGGRGAGDDAVPDASLLEGVRREGEAAEQRYRTIVESALDGILVFRSDATIAFMNESALRMFRAPALEAMAGRPVLDLVAPRMRETIAGRIGTILRAKQQLPLIPVTYLDCEGTEFPAEAHSAVIDYEGAPAVLVTIRDLRREEELEHRYRTLVERSSDGVFVYATDTTLLFANPAGLELLGADRPEQVLGRSAWDFVSPDSRPAVEERLRRAVETGKPQPPLREILLNVGGGAFPAEVSSMPISYEGAPALLATVRDLRGREAAAEAVAASEAFLRRVLDTTSELVYIYDLDENRNVYANREIVQYLGYDAEQVLAFGSELFARILHPDDLEAVAAHHARMATARDGETRDVEYRMRNSAGEWRWLHSRDVPFARDEAGRVTQILGSAQDTTERRLSEQALAEANAFQAAIFSAMPDGFSVLDTNGVHVSVNPALCAITGFSEDELVGAGPPHPYWPPEEYETIGRAFEATLRGEATDFELTFMRKSGERFPVLLTPAVIRDAHGAVLSAFSIVRDITDRVHAAEALRLSEERSRSVVSNLSEGIILQQADGTIVSFNAAAQRIFHIGEEQVVGKDSSTGPWRLIDESGEFLPGDAHPSMVSLRTHKPLRGVVVGIDEPGGVTWIEVNTDPLFGPGSDEPYAVVISLDDITQRREAERELARYKDQLEGLVAERTAELQASNAALEDASRAKGFFLASMSHELRTPLNSVIGFSGVMLQGLTGELTTEQRAQLEMINRAGKQLLGLVNDVLDLERIQAGHADVETESFDPAQLLRTIGESARPMAQDVGLDLELELAEAPRTVRSDRRKVEQIVLNFLSNAIKYTQTGTVAMGVAPMPGGEIAIWVRDTGPGIPVKDRERIFEEFSQLLPQRGGKHPGTGLGLAISRQFADLIGGRIEVESEVGAGSTFTLVLPKA